MSEFFWQFGPFPLALAGVDRFADRFGDRQKADAGRNVVQEDGAGAAGADAAAKAGIDAKFLAKDDEQRAFWIGVHGAELTIHF